jgi:hypothetical protein
MKLKLKSVRLIFIVFLASIVTTLSYGTWIFPIMLVCNSFAIVLATTAEHLSSSILKKY